MTIRDDEDLAVTQLPTRPAPGRPDDDELRRGATAGPERTAAEAEPPAPVSAQRTALRAVQAALVELAAQREALPLHELHELDAVEQESAQVRGQRDDVATRVASLPPHLVACWAALRTRTPQSAPAWLPPSTAPTVIWPRWAASAIA